MKAIRIHQFGPTEEVLQYEEVPTPAAGPGELLVKVEAASLNRADLSLRKGTYRVDPKDLPMIPGREFAGTVAAVGAEVSGFKPGQRVVAHPAKGGYAEHAVTRASLARPGPSISARGSSPPRARTRNASGSWPWAPTARSTTARRTFAKRHSALPQDAAWT